MGAGFAVQQSLADFLLRLLANTPVPARLWNLKKDVFTAGYCEALQPMFSRLLRIA